MLALMLADPRVEVEGGLRCCEAKRICRTDAGVVADGAAGGRWKNLQ